MKVYLGNAFSLQMLDTTKTTDIKVTPVDASVVANSDFTSVIGHQDTATVVSNILGKDVPCNRVSVSLSKGDILYVAQVVGGRLPAGATTLPDGFSLVFLKVVIL